MTLLAQARNVLQSAAAPVCLARRRRGHVARLPIHGHRFAGVRFTEFTVTTDKLASATADQLKQLGEKLSGRLTYLLEPICPIEVDREHCVVQMRSNPPQRDDDGTRYYELVVRRGGSLSLYRFSKIPGNVRETIPVNVTREVFFRLVSDFAAVAA